MTVAPPRLELRIMTPGDHTDIDIEPLQGLWTQAQYLQLTDHARLLMEFHGSCDFSHGQGQV